MAVRVALHHKTSYNYERPISMGAQVVRLRPAPHNRTPIHSYSLRIEPEEHFLNWQQDPHGNYLARIVVPEKTKVFSVEVSLVADLEAYNPFDFFLEPHAEKTPFKYSKSDLENLAPYLVEGDLTPRLSKFIDKVDRSPKRTVDFLVELNRQVHEAVEYVIRMEPGVQTPEETLKLAKGSCRDSAWLLVQICRHIGLAARFVSGYLIQLEPDERPLTGPQGPERDFTDLHAWTEVYVPGAGWIGLDATSGLLTAEGHIPLACSPSPGSAAPVEGAVEKAETEFAFDMHVERVVDRPRITKPYNDEQWAAIVARGHEVDEHLRRADVRLTMGGEPTFVSVKNPDADEWNTSALGPEKLAVADVLSRDLHELWAKGGLLHHGQGKWYPGEQLPRWAISVISRADGEPIWQDVDRFACSGASEGHTERDAERFTLELAKVLGLPTEGILPGYEDAWYYMWRERRLPANVDPLKSHLDDKWERERLAKVFRQGLGKVVGYVLPLAHTGHSFVTGRWFLREEHCFLYPGDSPMGYRLPLDGLPWVALVDRQDEPPLDPTAERPDLPSFQAIWAGLEGRSRPSRESAQIQRRGGAGGERGPLGKGEANALDPSRFAPSEAILAQMDRDAIAGLVKTALCAEPRDGILRLFLPPIQRVEAYLELCAAIEETSRRTGIKVQLEGYPPPEDPRLRIFKLTPDPGVLEVNVPPTDGWTPLLKQTEQLYAAAKLRGLTAEKFELDGRHVGSGGGNHLVLGANYALDSVFLRRPDVLRSLISFWHNHPSLSFLFAGQFIGPTSQAPRIDEGRNDSVYELEIAFAEILRHPNPHPWLVDRVFRHLLTDVTGNTHRTEFCIDKLYSPDSSTGRLGLVEMRAFEMPPHHRMASAQHLLVRSILAAFAHQPYDEALVKWGTSIHDRFLLPHFVRSDLVDALRFLQERGYPLDPEWFEPHFEFRFPYYGEIVKDDIILEVRGALEPWNVLGEEAGAGGQSRYVDSSVERIQVALRGATSSRHVACCNGVEIPLHPTGTRGESVAGIRYRAWQPPSCLHPTIGVHGPLRLDIFDKWNGRSIAGCTYHVVHPGGRANEVRPINAVAAESRRIARFEKAGHTPRSYQPIRAGVNPDFPATLDLRRLGL
jgi:uncharacterized protein (DUF2126 family)/transglutaminase-like putative cysteine protease